ncbi:MAG: lycopene cyclase family protein, partial [Ardenticatenaceae bacterium]|nr:lycopene cyclase family protein [Ardenticatenaceae bacterium]
MQQNSSDVLIVGGGPAGLALAAALGNAGLAVSGLAPDGPDAPWPNTYGIWRDELEAPGLTPDWLGHQWQDCTVYANGREIPLQRTYGLFDNQRLQADLLARGERAGVQWQRGFAGEIRHTGGQSQVTTRDGRVLAARLVVDASGHHAVFVRRPPKTDVAMQAAYGLVGRFSRPPVRPQQMVLMDFRSEHLPPEERQVPPTFLYAMDLGDDVYFVEETSLACYPAIPYAVLQRRLEQRLAYHGIAVTAVQHVEHCLFPMNLPLPYLDQPVMGYGGAASLVHPASGYQVGAALRYALEVARAIAQALDAPGQSPAGAARAAWQAL